MTSIRSPAIRPTATSREDTVIVAGSSTHTRGERALSACTARTGTQRALSSLIRPLISRMTDAVMPGSTLKLVGAAIVRVALNVLVWGSALVAISLGDSGKRSSERPSNCAQALA